MWSWRRKHASVAEAPLPEPASAPVSSPVPVPSPEVPITREDYRPARLAALRRVVDVASGEGLEVGAFDYPVVRADTGRCTFADVRSTERLARLFRVPIETVAPVEWVVDRHRPLGEQIPRRFDYVVLCHVLEHVPDPIGFLNDVGALVRPGGVVFLAVPDKRHTPDAARPSTTIDELLERSHRRARAPSVAQIMEFARTWSVRRREAFEATPREFLEWAVREHESGEADVHCNVWRDEELFDQLDLLARGGFLPGLEPCLRQPNVPPFNEFYAALRRND